MTKVFFIIIGLLSVLYTKAENGSRLWLRYDTLKTAKVSGYEGKAAEILRLYYPGNEVTLTIDNSLNANDGYAISINNGKAKIKVIMKSSSVVAKPSNKAWVTVKNIQINLSDLKLLYIRKAGSR